MDWLYSWVTPTEPPPINFEGNAVSLSSNGETLPGSLDFETEAVSLKSTIPQKPADFHMGPGTMKVSMLLHSEARENLCKVGQCAFEIHSGSCPLSSPFEVEFRLCFDRRCGKLMVTGAAASSILKEERKRRSLILTGTTPFFAR